MASIYERKHPSGRTTWKICVRKRGIKSFFLTFDDLDEACDWIEKNEMEFYKDPDKYFKWREDIYYKMHRQRKKTYNHILKPKPRH
jgi:hypothetical protein